jgi:integrase/recombinase XerC
MPAIHARVLLQTRIDQFLAYCAIPDLSPHTIKAYRSDLAEFAALMRPKPTTRRINRKLLRRFMARLHARGLSRSSIVRSWAAVKSFCNWLQAEGVIDWSLIELMPPRRRRQALPDVPSQKEMRHLLEGDIPGPCPERDRVILELLYSGGLRAAEVVGVNVDDNQEADTLLVRGKEKKSAWW